MNCIIKLKEELKKQKRNLNSLLHEYELELDNFIDIGSKAVATFFGRINGVEKNKFNYNIEDKLKLTQQLIKYSNELDKLLLITQKYDLLLKEDFYFRRVTCGGGDVYSTIVDGSQLLHDKLLNNNENINEIFMDFINNNDNMKDSIKLATIRIRMSYFIKLIKFYLLNITNIINAFDDNKVKSPINDINMLYSTLIILGISEKDISKILGMVVNFNSQYAKKNKKHNIKDIDLINKLAQYYNSDGSFKKKSSINELENLLNTLKNNSLEYFRMILILNKLIWSIKKEPQEIINKFYTKLPTMKQINQNIINLLNISNLKNENLTQEVSNNFKENLKGIQTNDIEFYKYLRKIYKDGEIITIPDNLEEFYLKLENSPLDNQEKNFIKKLLEEKITNKRFQTRLKYLNKEHIKIYESATKLLDNLNNSNPDFYTLKQYLEDIQVIIEMLAGEISVNDKKDLLEELSNIIIELSSVCNKYKVTNDTSINKYIFLINKDGNPYIYDDITSLDQSYRRTIISLITRITPYNKSKFKPIKNNYKLQYQLQEYLSSSTHIAFIEIDCGIYAIIGANTIRNGYEIFVNRLKANQEIIKQYESLVKNPNTRNELLREHEIYLNLVTDNKQTKGKIKLLVNPKSKKN